MNVATAAYQRLRKIEREIGFLENSKGLFRPFQELEDIILSNLAIGKIDNLNRDSSESPFLFITARNENKQVHLTPDKLTMVFAEIEVDIQSQDELDHFLQFWKFC